MLRIELLPSVYCLMSCDFSVLLTITLQNNEKPLILYEIFVDDLCSPVCYAAIVRRMESLPGVTHVLKRYQPPAQPASDDTLTTTCEPIVVDIICNHGYTWVKVVARKAEALHRIWAGKN